MNELTIHGNVTADVGLKYTSGGTAWTRFTVAINRGHYNSRRQWVEEPTVFMTVLAFNQLAENVAGLPKGTAVTVSGQLADDSYTPKNSTGKDSDAQKVWGVQVRATDIAVSLRNATAAVTKNPARSEQPVAERQLQPAA